MITKIPGKVLKPSVPVQANTNILKYIVDKQQEAYEKGRKSILSDLRKEMRESFGPCNKAINGEYYLRVWVLEFRDLTFNVATAKGLGTGLEICGKSYEEVSKKKTKLEQDIIDFIDLLNREVIR